MTALLSIGLAAFASFKYEDFYSCPVCLQVAQGEPCSRFGACHVVADGVRDCVAAGHCTAEQMRNTVHSPQTGGTAAQLRVSKGFGTKPYAAIRVSMITANDKSLSGFDYDQQFQYKWTGNRVHTKLIAHPSPGSSATIDLGNGESASIFLPKQGDGVAGVIIADPCFKGSIVGCSYADKFQTATRTPEMLNALLSHSDTQYWGILGDNFYDQSGSLTTEFYNKLELTTTEKPLVTVPGNHDYWVLGSPLVGGPNDQYANGHMQWYTQDAKASEPVQIGDKACPFDYSVKPTGRHLPSINNSFLYHQMGNVGVVGWSGAYTLDETMPLMKESCAWLAKNHRSNGGSIDVAMLMGHWDTSGLGASEDMAGPGFYDHMKVIPGCDLFESKNALKFIMGHTHCNVPHPHGKVGAGFMVAGQGMSGCGNYGFPVFDTSDNRIRIWHFEVYAKNGTDSYDTKLACIKANGWRQCTHLADSWLDQPFSA